MLTIVNTGSILYMLVADYYALKIVYHSQKCILLMMSRTDPVGQIYKHYITLELIIQVSIVFLFALDATGGPLMDPDPMLYLSLLCRISR